MKFVTYKEYQNSPEWRSIRMVGLLDNNIELKVIDLNDPIPEGYVPVGSVEFCRKAAKNIDLPDIDFPEKLNSYLKRKIEKSTLKNSVGYFTKPIQIKLFEAGVQEPTDNDTECWKQEIVNFQHEWRVYILNNEILGIAQYDFHEEDLDLNNEQLDEIQNIINDYTNSPIAYALDVGLTDDNIFMLIEVNDAWGTGYYPNGSMSKKDYALWLYSRWEELMNW